MASSTAFKDKIVRMEETVEKTTPPALAYDSLALAVLVLFSFTTKPATTAIKGTMAIRRRLNFHEHQNPKARPPIAVIEN
mmetsp:Transcript_12380/g.26098  ORF Transcript_12380/g.26098 Transcript_12380/m.26098 type:complete len:80 (-) Transcript_12380:991-1230(-)